MNTKYHPKTILFSSMGNRPDILSSWITNDNNNNECYDYDIIIYTYTDQLSDKMKQLLLGTWFRTSRPNKRKIFWHKP